jgi:Fur family ferric uptake transcriptional regulator
MYEKLLRKAGLKITGPRQKILSLLHDKTKRHWSAESMHQVLLEQDEDVGLATVYRVLTQFEMCGLVKRHFFENDVSVVELNESEHHDHVVCVECGSVEEFLDDVIEQHQKKIADRFNFKMTDHRLIIYGVCAKCQK